MAELKNVSSRLESFIKDVYENSSELSSNANSLLGEVTASKGKYQSALDDVASAWTSSDSSETKSVLELIINACSNIETSINSDLLTAISDFDKVKVEYDTVLDIRKQYENETDENKIKNANARIDNANAKGEATISAIKSGLDDVSLGIIGNMKRGGSLGPVTKYNLTVNFTPITPEEVAEKHTSFLGNVGSFCLGLVKSVIDLGEGIVDAGATALATVVSWADQGSSDAIRDWVESDQFGEGFDEWTNSLDWYNETAGSIGHTAGDVGTFVTSVFCPPIAVLHAIGVAGETMESFLNWGPAEGNWGLYGSLVVGGAVGLLDRYATNKLHGKFASWRAGRAAPPAVTVPVTPAVTAPVTPAVTVPVTPAVTVPVTPAVTVPVTPAVTVPVTPAVTVPVTPVVTVPVTPAVTGSP